MAFEVSTHKKITLGDYIAFNDPDNPRAVAGSLHVPGVGLMGWSVYVCNDGSLIAERVGFAVVVENADNKTRIAPTE